MLSTSVILGMILVGVILARSLKSNRIMPDVEDFIIKTGLLGAFIGIAILQAAMAIIHNDGITVIGTLTTIYIGCCAGYDMIENYNKNKSNKRAIVKSILIG